LRGEDNIKLGSIRLTNTRKFSIPPFDTDEYQRWKGTSSLAEKSSASISNKETEAQGSSMIDVLTQPSSSGSAQPANPIPQEAQDANPQDDDDHPPRLSYAQLVELIQTGAPIPGIKDIPDTVLAGQGTEAVAAKRRKPWEKDETSEKTDTSAPPGIAAEASTA
jgi:hypothetical protein